jgi:hypothetical protein
MDFGVFRRVSAFPLPSLLTSGEGREGEGSCPRLQAPHSGTSREGHDGA